MNTGTSGGKGPRPIARIRGARAAQPAARGAGTAPPRSIRVFHAADIHHRLCEKAATILERVHESATALLKAFDLVRTPTGRRSARVGMTTDEEQDILRAMLIMAAAGLDAMAKQLIRDTLPSVAHVNEQARAELEKFLAREFTGEVRAITEEGKAAKFVAGLLSAADLPRRAVALHVEDLTAGSLQAAPELRRMAAAFGLTPDKLRTNFQSLTGIFEVRNKIIHELDINLDVPRRVRNMRNKNRMVSDANALLQTGEELLRAVDGHLGDLGIA